MHNLRLRSQPLFTGHMSVYKEPPSPILTILMPDDNFMKKVKNTQQIWDNKTRYCLKTVVTDALLFYCKIPSTQ